MHLLPNSIERHARTLVTLLTILVAGVSTMSAQLLPRESAEEQGRRLDEARERAASDPFTESSREDIVGRNVWYSFQRSFPFDVVPAGLHKHALRQMNSVRDRMHASAVKSGASLFAANLWSEIGPLNVGGRIRSIVLHPTNPQIMYVGAVAGGVWKTTDGGNTWRSTFDKQSSIAIGAIAIDPVNPNIVYAGTGEMRVASDIGYLADGAFKSTDGGETWRNIGLNDLSSICKIHVHKSNPQIIYIASGRLHIVNRYEGDGLGTSEGFYRSTDGGSTWKQIVDGNVIEMAVNPANNDELVVTTSRAVRRSVDGGANFTQINTGIASLLGTARMSVTYDPTTPTTVYLLQAFIAAGGKSHAANLYRSTNSGDDWSLVKLLDSRFFAFQGDYNNCVAIDPNDPNSILVGGVDLWRSTDGGSEFYNVTNTRGSVFDSELSHPDQHVIVFDHLQPGVVYIGNDGGVYKSITSGDSFRRLHSELAITQFHTVEIDQSRPYRVYGGTQDNNTQAGISSPTEYTKTWTRLLGGDGFWVVVDNTNPDIVYAEYQYGRVHRIRMNELDSSPVEIGGGIQSDGGAWSTPMAISPIDGRLYSARGKVHRTSTQRDSTVTWQTINPGYQNVNRKSVALALSPHDAAKFIAGNDFGDVRFTVDDGALWLKAQNLPVRFPTDLTYDPIDRNRVYATFSGFKTGHVFVSNDNGAMFTDITANLPDVPVNTIEIDPTDSRRLFIGTDIGVYVSLDAGGSWFPFSERLPVVPVADMKIHRTRRVLIAATHGRSMFEASIDNISIPAVLLAPIGGEVIATPGDLMIRWGGFNGPVNVSVSYRAGDPFTVIAPNVVGTSFKLQLPSLQTTTARVRVEAVSGGQTATSGEFTLNVTSNIETVVTPAFFAEAIAVRNDELWVTSRTDDSIRRLILPGLSQRGAVMRTGFSGRIRDLAYDTRALVFYALVTESDFTNPRIYKLDTNGAAIATITIDPSIARVGGIDVVNTGIAIATPGADGRIVVIDAGTGALTSSSPYGSVRGDWRRGLVWNGRTFTQGVVRSDAGVAFASEVQQLSISDSARLFESLTIIPASGGQVYFFDLAADARQSTRVVYYATDTAGVIYRFVGAQFSSIRATDDARTSDARFGDIAPNPVRDAATVSIVLEHADDIQLDLINAAGERIAHIFTGRLDRGVSERAVDVRGVAGGVYYLVMTTTSGARIVTPIVVIQ
ncbi:MAG: hypothetical protein H7X80_09355 [bacterium]|nr:hypothetical protein [Candidatus Kapabacteria bacterium]